MPEIDIDLPPEETGPLEPKVETPYGWLRISEYGVPKRMSLRLDSKGEIAFVFEYVGEPTPSEPEPLDRSSPPVWLVRGQNRGPILEIRTELPGGFSQGEDPNGMVSRLVMASRSLDRFGEQFNFQMVASLIPKMVKAVFLNRDTQSGGLPQAPK